jgi:hypothetical protein
LHVFNARQWYARRVPEGEPDLICSNSPLGLIFFGPPYGGKLLRWLEPYAFVVMPLSRRVVAFGGVVDGVEPPKELNRNWVVAINRAVAKGASQLYSAERTIAI